MQITNGSITFERNRKTADYEGKKASVTLSFVIPEGEEPNGVLASVGAIAMSRALIMVGEAPEAHEASPAFAEAPRVVIPATRTRKTPPKAELSPVTNGGDPSQPTEAPLSASPFGGPAVAPAEPSSAAAQPGPWPNPALLTDDALNRLVVEKVTSHPNSGIGERTLKLIESLGGDRARRIPSLPIEKRAEFRAKLEELK